MARILELLVLLSVYQTVHTQRTIRWGKFLCDQVENKCKQDFIGSPGARGPIGITGLTGATGRKGSRGQKGAKGYSYIVDPYPLIGLKGRKGQPGLPGRQGPTGLPGNSGFKGARGEQGARGPKGDKGSPGFPGREGRKGQPGRSGSIYSWKICTWDHDPRQQYGLLKECVFTKQSNLSLLHVIFEGSMRVGFCNSCCKRWFFAFNNVECENANIEARLRGTKEFAGMEYRHVRLEGYCAVPAGEVLVELWVQDCSGQQRAPEVPFVKVDLNPRVTVEEINLSDV